MESSISEMSVVTGSSHSNNGTVNPATAATKRPLTKPAAMPRPSCSTSTVPAPLDQVHHQHRGHADQADEQARPQNGRAALHLIEEVHARERPQQRVQHDGPGVAVDELARLDREHHARDQRHVAAEEEQRHQRHRGIGNGVEVELRRVERRRLEEPAERLGEHHREAQAEQARRQHHHHAARRCARGSRRPRTARGATRSGASPRRARAAAVVPGPAAGTRSVPSRPASR